MDYTLDDLKADPGFQTADTSQQQQMELEYTKDAWGEASKDLSYAGGDLQTRQQYREMFDQAHPLGATVRPDDENYESSFAQDIKSQFNFGVQQTKDAMEVGMQAYKDSTQSNKLAKIITEAHERNGTHYIPPAYRETQAAMQAESKRWDKAIFVEEKIAAAGKTVMSTFNQIFTNPKGVALLATESLPNMAAPVVGGVGGGVSAGPGGAAVGVFGGSFATEQGAYLKDKIIQTLNEEGKEINEANVQALIDDRETFENLESASYRKAAATAGVDTALSLIGGKVGSVKKGTTPIKKTAAKAKTFTAEVASEPISEAAGQLAAEGKVDAGELMGETLGGIGASVAMTPTDIALFGDKETKAKKETKTKETALSKAPTAVDYKDKVAETVETGEVKDIADPESDNFNPIMAAESLQKINQKDTTAAIDKIKNEDQAQDMYNALDEKKQAIIKEARELGNKEGITEEEYKEKSAALINEAKDIQSTLKTIKPLIQSMSEKGADKPAIVKEISESLKSNDSEVVKDSILSVFGSKRGADLVESDNFTAILNNPQIDDNTKSQIKLVQEYQNAEKDLIQSQKEPGKGVSGVHSDVIDGGVGFKGIKNYAQAVTIALKENDTATVQKQLGDLKSFTDKHTMKADTFTQVYTSFVTKQPVPKEVQARMDKYNQIRINKGLKAYNLNTKNAEKFVNTIATEAKALNSAVSMITSWTATPSPSPAQATGSSATEVGDVAIAKEPTEGSTRTVAVPDTTPKPHHTKKTVELTAKYVNRNAGIKHITNRVANFQDLISDIKDPAKREKLTKNFSDKLIGDYGGTNFQDIDDALHELDEQGIKYVYERSDGGNLGGLNKHHGEVHSLADADIKKTWGEIYAGEVVRYGGIIGRDQGDEFIVIWPNFTLDEVTEIRADIEVQLRNRIKEMGIDKVPHPKKKYNDMPTGALYVNYGLIEGIPGKYGEMDRTADEQMAVAKEEFEAIKSAEVGYVYNEETGQYEYRETESKIRATEERRTEGKDDTYIQGDERPEVETESVSSIEETGIQVKLTTPVETDNRVKNTFKPKKTKGQLQKTDDILEVMIPEHMESVGVFDEKNPLNDEARTVINSIKDFGTQFTKAFNKEFTVKKSKDYRFEDPIQYLLNEDDTVPANVVNALMAASYKWVGGRSNETVHNYADDIRTILDLQEDAPINKHAYNLLGDLGTTATALQETLGREAFDLLGIEPSATSDSNIQNKLELSLGLQAIATMQSMGILKQRDVLRGAAPGQEATSTIGLSGLINSQSNVDTNLFINLADNFFVPEDKAAWQKYKGQGFISFYRVATENGAIKKTIDDRVITPFKGSRNTWDRVFKGENDKTTYSWEKPKKSIKPMKLKGTSFVAAPLQQKNLQTHEARPYKVSPRTMGFYLLMGENNLAKIQGTTDPKLSHIENIKTAEGVNFGISRTNEHVKNWVNDATNQEGGFNSEFYIPEEFWRQGRMGQVGTINPQGDKTHRFLFNMSAWERDIDLTNNDQREQFLEAVALGLDIEVSKEGGLDQAIQKLQNLLEEPVMIDALKAINTVFDGRGDMNELTIDDPDIIKHYSKEMAAITEGVLKAGVNMHSLKALIEYSRYRSALAKGKEIFNTDLITEIDGVSNGMTIGRIQLMSDDADAAETLTALQNAGISFSNTQPGLAVHLARNLSHDAYQSIGFAWAGALVDIESKISFPQERIIFKAMKRLFGDFRDETGNVSKIVRKLSKDPTMKTVYGMGKKTLIKELQESFIASIYEKMEKAVKNNDVNTLRSLNKDLKDITGRYIFGSNAVKDNSIVNEVVLTTKLTKEDMLIINENIEEHHGAALNTAIFEVYGKMQGVFKPLNNGLNMAAVLYNSILKIKIQQAETKASQENREVTVGEMKEITESVQDMFPRVKTVFGGEIPLAKKSREKSYSHRAKGVINQEVQQKYKNLPGKKAAPFAKSGIEAPGVGGTILSVHNQDSVIANTVMGSFDILNNHDGFSIGVGQALDMGKAANKAFYETMKNYNMAEELFNSTSAIVDNFVKQQTELKKLGITQAEINKAIVTEFNNIGTKRYKLSDSEKPVSIDTESYPAVMKDIIAEMGRVATETKKNKEILINSMTAVEQYSFEGGQYKTGNTSEVIDIVGQKFNPVNITKEAEKRLTGAIQATDEVAKVIGKLEVKTVIDNPGNNNIAEAEKQIKGSSQESTKLSIDPKDYTVRKEVDSMNVIDVYNQVKNSSNITDSPTHDAHLQSILGDIIQNVMDPVDVFMKENPDLEPEGLFVNNEKSTDSIFISNQNTIIGPVSGVLSQGIRMSTGEVYTHELLHGVLHTGLSQRANLRNRVDRLFDITKRELGTDGYKVFLNNPNTTNIYEIEAAKERYDYIFNNTETQKTSQFTKGVDPATGITRIQEKSNYLDEFMALALTNENFGKALSDINLTDTAYRSAKWKGIVKGNIQETLGNIAQLIMDFLFSKFTTKYSAPTVDREIKNLAINITAKNSDNKSALYHAIVKASDKFSMVSEYGNKFIKKAVTSRPIVKSAIRTKETLEYVKGTDTKLGQYLREVEYAYQRLDHGLIKSMAAEIAGRTDRVAWLHKLLSRRQIFLDQAKQTASDTMIASLNDLFENPLSEAQKTSITKVGLKTDSSILNSYLGSKGLIAVLKDKKELNKQINKIINEIDRDSDLAPHSTYYRRAADALGHFMINARARKGEIVFQSTQVIASLRNTQNDETLTENQINKAEGLVDKLASLYAIKYTQAEHRNEFINLMEKETEAIDEVFRTHEVLKEESLREAFNDNKYKFIKGYTKQILNSRINIKYGMELDQEIFAQEGYTMLERSLVRDEDDPGAGTPMHMYISKIDKVNDLLSTIFSYTGNRAKGTSPSDIASSLDLPSKTGVDNTNEIIRKKGTTLGNMADSNLIPELTPGHFMIPQVDENGRISKYRYMMTEETKDSHMEQITDFTKIMGAMAGQVIDKVRSPQINHELIQGLHSVFTEDYTKNPGSFVEIGPNAEDPRLREIYFMMPLKAQSDIKRTWNSQAIFIPKDFVDLSFGYRQYSITDAFIKDPKDRAKMERLIVAVAKMLFKDKAIQRAGTIESVMSEMTKFAKSNIIIKSLHVTLNNLGSNMIYLKSRGVPVSTIIKLGWEAIAMGNKYQADAKKLDKLELKKKALQKSTYTSNQMRDINNEIIRLKDTIARNPATLTIQAGLMPSLVDDIETITSGSNFPTAFEKKVSEVAGKFPQKVQQVGKVIALTEDTQAFKVLNNAVKMTDFIGRYVLYSHYTKGGMKHEEAISSVEDEFVNFNIPTHRIIEYGNKIGMLWFTKYAMRILKVIKDSVVDKPFDVFMAYMLSIHAGTDNILNSTPTGINDLLNHVGNPIDSLIGSLDEPVTISGIDKIIE